MRVLLVLAPLMEAWGLLESADAVRLQLQLQLHLQLQLPRYSAARGQRAVCH
jgi:hypothetical protein